MLFTRKTNSLTVNLLIFPTQKKNPSERSQKYKVHLIRFCRLTIRWRAHAQREEQTDKSEKFTNSNVIWSKTKETDSMCGKKFELNFFRFDGNSTLDDNRMKRTTKARRSIHNERIVRMYFLLLVLGLRWSRKLRNCIDRFRQRRLFVVSWNCVFELNECVACKSNSFTRAEGVKKKKNRKSRSLRMAQNVPTEINLFGKQKISLRM